MKGLLIGEAPTEAMLGDIERAIAGAPHVVSLIHLRSMHLGPEDLLVAAKIDFDHDLSVAELASAIDTAEVAIRAAVPLDITIYIEPDIRRTSAGE
jgi:divalent metal cation (Fe/Co/Zn/Cd) transporter